MNPVAAMATCTTRIVAANGNHLLSIGTGFFYSITGQSDFFIPVLITNKHVLEGCDRINIVLTTIEKKTILDTSDLPNSPEFINFEILISNQNRVNHPDSNVDLCAVLIAPILNHLETIDRNIYHCILNSNLRLNTEDRQLLRAAEPITMVGYPNGLWDETNNSPIIRRGITATHPLVKYEGKNVFMIDAACFQGSSGSPVFLHEDGMFRSGRNSYSPGTKISLLGVLYAGPQFTVDGKLEIKPIPHSYTVAPITNIPMNLGYVISADEIDVICDVARKQLNIAIPN